MTIDELIKILENYEMFVDDDFGGSYKSVIAYAPDKKVSRAHTPIGILKIIDAFEEVQQEIQELKKQLSNSHQMKMKRLQQENRKLKQQISNSHQIKTQQKEFIEYLEKEKDRLSRECSQIYEDSLGKTRLVSKDIHDEISRILSKYKEIIGGKDE